MRPLRFVASVAALVFVACAAPPPGGGGDFGEPDGGSIAPVGCESTLLCYPGCQDDDPTCVKGTLDPVACTCVDVDGSVTPLPRPDAGTPSAPDGDSTTSPDAGTPDFSNVASISFKPALPAKFALGDELTVKVNAKLTSGTMQDLTEVATITITPAGAFERVAAGRYRAASLGVATITAKVGTKTASSDVQVLKAEARAVWITRFGFKTAADIKRIINDAADNHFNVVFLQIRGMGDAYYKSTLEPWAAGLTGTLGKDPGWDPLQVAIDTAHGRGLELHAYVNAFTAWTASGSPPASASGAPPHPLRAHPEWLEVTANGVGADSGGEYQWFSPGVEAVRQHNVAVIREILTKYQVDGIHLDRIRYSGSTMGYNALARQAYAAQYGSDQSRFTQWRVEQVNRMVRAAYDAVLEVRPKAKLSASVWGIHTRLPHCTTSQGLADYFQDSWAWAQGGYIDALAPMIYWAEGTGCTDYGDLLQTFLDHKGDRMIWSGTHVYDGGRLDWNKLSLRIDTARAASAQGIVFFASNYLDTAQVWPMLGNGPFHDEALVPKGKR